MTQIPRGGQERRLAILISAISWDWPVLSQLMFNIQYIFLIQVDAKDVQIFFQIAISAQSNTDYHPRNQLLAEDVGTCDMRDLYLVLLCNLMQSLQ